MAYTREWGWEGGIGGGGWGGDTGFSGQFVCIRALRSRLLVGDHS